MSRVERIQPRRDGFELPPLREPPTFGAHLVRRAVGITLASMAVIGAAATAALFMFDLDIALDAAGILEPRLIEAVRSPVSGVVATVEVAPGERVEAGQAVVRLDGFALQARLQQLRLETHHKRDRPETSRQELEELEQRMATARRELRRQVLRSPIAGTVLTEELEQRIGSRVVEGDLLLEVGLLDAWRARLLVAENEIHLIAIGDPVKIEIRAATAVDSWRHQLLDATVTFVGTDPVEETAAGRSFYRVFAELDGNRLGTDVRDRFRRGMSVEARVITRSASGADLLVRFFRRSIAS